MSLVRTIHGQRYLPLRAVPVITSGVLSADVLAAMIARPDNYCDADHDQVISPCRRKQDGSLLTVHHLGFDHWPTSRRSTGTCQLYGGEHLPPGLLVKLAAVQEKYELVVAAASRRVSARRWPTAAFDLNPEVSATDLLTLLEGLAPIRTNSAAALADGIASAVHQLVRLCAQNGLAVDRACLPGNSKHLQRIVSRLVPRAGEVATATFKDHCHRLGIGWRQGLEQDKLLEFMAIAGTQ